MVGIKQLKQMADKLRIHSIEETTAAGSGHPTSCMSIAEIMSAVFFSDMDKDDELVLSKGHAAPILWAAYAEAGLIKKTELKNLRKIDSPLEGHPTPNMPIIKIATGSLGQGLSAGVGIALGKRLAGKSIKGTHQSKGRVYVIMGDGEIAEGSVWEAANSAAHFKLTNICAVVDVNRLGQSQQTMHGYNVNIYKKKFEAFGWEAKIIDGHNMKEVLSALLQAKNSKKPFVIIAKTKKGKGFSEVEDKEGWHGKPFNKELKARAIKELDNPNFSKLKLKTKFKHHKTKYSFKDFSLNKYELGDHVATRSAYGNALVNLGKKNATAVAIDGDVQNSTMTQAFFKAFPERSFESYIAEQNMVGMAAGLSAEGYSPYVATFATFLTRAHDFIRMAGISKANIKIAGSHVGVSIGEDGASQMGLEDISMFLSMPESLMMYPCDAVSAEACLKETAKYEGISFLRTTREKTPVIYKNGEHFKAGGLKVIKQSKRDEVLVIGAGITVHEALKAYESLKHQMTHVRVIDLYSIRPVDAKALIKNAKECYNRVIVVEDHFFGGIGQVVSSVLGKIEHLYVKGMPRSGKPEQLRKIFGIDAAAIEKSVRKLLS